MKKTRKHVKKMIAIMLTATIAATLLSGCSGGIGKKNINLNDYVEVTFGGREGYGTAKASIDYAGITEDYGDKVKLNDDSGMALLYYGETVGDILRDYVTVSASPAEGLSNGDEVSLVWYVDDYYIEDILNCTVSYADKEYEVDGLDEVGTVDVFDGVDVSFTGTSPQGKASLTADGQFSRDGYSLPYQWTVTPDSGLANGDTVTVSFEMTDESAFISQYGAVPEYTEKEYTVEGLDSYVTDISQLSKDNLNALKAEAKDQINAYCEKNGFMISSSMGLYSIYASITHGDLSLQNIYLYVPKDAGSYRYDDGSYNPVFVYSTKATAKYGSKSVDGEIWFAVRFTGLVLEEDGNLVGTTNNLLNYYTSSDQLYKNFVTANKDNYNITIYDADLNVVK